MKLMIKFIGSGAMVCDVVFGSIAPPYLQRIDYIRINWDGDKKIVGKWLLFSQGKTVSKIPHHRLNQEEK
jgi:hypothetical protein